MEEEQPQKTSKSWEDISALLSDFTQYDVQDCDESVTKQSRIMQKCGCKIISDDDVWFEKKFLQKHTGQVRSFFISRKTGKKSPDEPPSGASKVLYLKSSNSQDEIRTSDKDTNVAVRKQRRNFLSNLLRLCRQADYVILEYNKPPATITCVHNDQVHQ